MLFSVYNKPQCYFLSITIYKVTLMFIMTHLTWNSSSSSCDRFGSVWCRPLYCVTRCYRHPLTLVTSLIALMFDFSLNMKLLTVYVYHISYTRRRRNMGWKKGSGRVCFLLTSRLCEESERNKKLCVRAFSILYSINPFFLSTFFYASPLEFMRSFLIRFWVGVEQGLSISCKSIPQKPTYTWV